MAYKDWTIEGQSGWDALRSVLSDLEWDSTRMEVDEERLGRIALVGLPGVGKSTLFNRLQGWEVSSVQPAQDDDQPTDGLRMESLGLFTLVDLPTKDHDDNRSDWGDGFWVHDALLASLAEMDLVVFVLNSSQKLRREEYRWLSRIRATGRPLLTVLNKMDGQENNDEEAAEAELRRQLGTRPVPVCALTGWGVQERLVPRILDACPRLALALGREMACFRPLVTRRVIHQASVLAALLGAEPIPLLDVPLQLAAQVRMVMRLGELYDRPGVDRSSKELIATMIVAVGLRYLAQQVAKLLPVLGWALSGLLAAVSTWFLGRSVVAYFERGHGGLQKQSQRPDWGRWWQQARSKVQGARRKLRKALRTMQRARAHFASRTTDDTSRGNGCS